MTVQVFYTFCFTLSLIGTALTGILVLCPGEDFERSVLKLGYIDLFISCESPAFLSIIFHHCPCPLRLPHSTSLLHLSVHCILRHHSHPSRFRLCFIPPSHSLLLLILLSRCTPDHTDGMIFPPSHVSIISQPCFSHGCTSLRYSSHFLITRVFV